MNLGDIKAKTIPIFLDRERQLKFDLNSFASLEELYGDINIAFEAMQKGSMKALRAMLWAGLIHEDASLTAEQVGSMVDMGNINQIMEALSKAVNEAMPESEEIEGKN